MKEVVVVIGPGQIGQAIGRRIGFGKRVLLADKRLDNAKAAADVLDNAGNDVSVTTVDVASRQDVLALVEAASGLGQITWLVHAAGAQTPFALRHAEGYTSFPQHQRKIGAATEFAGAFVSNCMRQCAGVRIDNGVNITNVADGAGREPGHDQHLTSHRLGVGSNGRIPAYNCRERLERSACRPIQPPFDVTS